MYSCKTSKVLIDNGQKHSHKTFHSCDRLVWDCYRLDGPRFESRDGQKIFLFSKTSRRALGSTKPPVQWASKSYLGGKAAGAASAEVKNEWRYTSTPPLYLYAVDRDSVTLRCLELNSALQGESLQPC